MRWILLFCVALSLPAVADLDYALKPRQIAEDTWLLEGSTDNFAKANGGNIVNVAFIVTQAGVVVKATLTILPPLALAKLSVLPSSSQVSSAICRGLRA